MLELRNLLTEQNSILKGLHKGYLQQQQQQQQSTPIPSVTVTPALISTDNRTPKMTSSDSESASKLNSKSSGTVQPQPITTITPEKTSLSFQCTRDIQTLLDITDKLDVAIDQR